ncbi:arylamine N-acetyltransferase, pineal gland isozyme NAT-10-like isoform X2 [Carcharodon carcharias]|nr:arylamine N-acetyltransferase, pineal gland isozyme NAT-10-like isoform X2 [Carcharodon carcharias]
MEVGKYLARIGYRGPTEPTLENLMAIHHCHLLSVPFGSLAIHCGEGIVPELPRLYRKIVEERRGGFCYELNSLFAWLLEELGYPLRLLSGQVRSPITGRFGPPFDHLLILAQPGGRSWLCDVGFGRAFRTPLPLEAGRPQAQENGVFELGLEAGAWHLRRRQLGGQGAGDTLYRFTLEGRRREDFGPMCEYHQRSPSSVFACKAFCSLQLPQGMVTYMGRRLIETEYSAGGERQVTTRLTEEQIPLVLRERFGIVLRNTLVPRDEDVTPPPDEY